MQYMGQDLESGEEMFRVGSPTWDAPGIGAEREKRHS